MRILAIETATAACSVALFDGQALIAHCHQIVGRGHAELLLPMIASLPDGGRADSVLVGCGPGSFTGLRVGIAAAKGLALAWDVPVHGFPTLSLIAAKAFTTGIVSQNETLVVANEGGHGEVFIQRFAFDDPSGLAPVVSLPFEQAGTYLCEEDQLVGTAAVRLAAEARVAAVQELLPDARSAMHLPASLINLAAQPAYGRGADAKPQAAP